MRIVCISDTHLQHGFTVPHGDVLIHAGDATWQGTLPEIQVFADWFGALPHLFKIFVPGNHDYGFERQAHVAAAMVGPPPLTHVLMDSGCTISGVRFWGSPWQPEFYNWAFNLPRGPELARHWDMVPDVTDVLITHTPPFGVLDRTAEGERVGCVDMRAMLARVRPALHVFGHIHAAYGSVIVRHADGASPTQCVNAAVCNEHYKPINPPIVVELTPKA
jgi:predicted phosphohydrolase